jgi:hypothetical protein
MAKGNAGFATILRLNGHLDLGNHANCGNAGNRGI